MTWRKEKAAAKCHHIIILQVSFYFNYYHKCTCAFARAAVFIIIERVVTNYASEMILVSLAEIVKASQPLILAATKSMNSFNRKERLIN
jgi:hypothetical protein